MTTTCMYRKDMLPGNAEHEKGKDWEDLEQLLEVEVCQGSTKGHVEDFTEGNVMMEDLAKRAKEILSRERGCIDDFSLKNLEECFKSCDKKLTMSGKEEEFEILEAFIMEEQTLGRERRSQARKVEAKEEQRLAAEIASLKGFRLKSQIISTHDELQRKISDSERAYANRKMVYAKASQRANAECRLQFTRVRDFFEKLHVARQEQLRRQYRRSLKLQELTHKIRGSDARVVALERQIANRLYHKKKTDLNELHMAQNMEESIYLEAMLDLLDQVQSGKEAAAKDLFTLQVNHLKAQRESGERRSLELGKLLANATEEIANLMAYYTDDEEGNLEAANKIDEKVEATERRKDFKSAGDNNTSIMSVSELYDTVLWSVATSQLGLSSSGSSMYSSDYSSDDMGDYFEDEEGEEDGEQHNEQNLNESQDIGAAAGQQHDPNSNQSQHHDLGPWNDAGSTQSSAYEGSTTNGADHEMQRVSTIGRMHIKQRSKELRAQEKALIKKHEAEVKKEKKQYRAAVRELRRKHQFIVEGLVSKSLVERQKLRDRITDHMNKLVKKQEETTVLLKDIIEKDVKVMEEALRAEDQRVESAQKESFAKAQTLISAQVFHEVRNALSSVISMSEMTTSLKNDTSVSPTELVASVDEMLDQIKEIVNYALQILNNVLDVTKINTGQFSSNDKPFDLQELMIRATKMQMAKTGRVKMRYVPNPEPCIVNSDSDIIIRIIVNFISNAVKFTSNGAIQPFIWTEGEIRSGSHDSTEQDSVSNDSNSAKKIIRSRSSGSFDFSSFHDLMPNKNMKLVAVGVADTGPGLTADKLFAAEKGLSHTDNSSVNSGAKNSGFGLHLAHLLAKSLGTRLHLTSLEKCRKLLNEDMLDAMDQRQRDFGAFERDIDVPDSCSSSLSGASSSISDFDDVDNIESHAWNNKLKPGGGTVLYMTLPIYDDGYGAEKALRQLARNANLFGSGSIGTAANSEDSAEMKFKFYPQPSPTSSNGCFRILVADDVLMLRKGLVHTISNLFTHCRVSINTACSGEDVMRAVESQPYDLVISDHLFDHDPSILNPVSAEEEKTNTRPSLCFDIRSTPKEEVHKMMRSYFKNERFTIRHGDGIISGLGALTKLAKKQDLQFPTPLLMLLSGHKLEAPPELGIIIAQKPLKKTELFPLFEENVIRLIASKKCCLSEQITENGTAYRTLVGAHGNQLFVEQYK